MQPLHLETEWGGQAGLQKPVCRGSGPLWHRKADGSGWGCGAGHEGI